MHNNVIDTTTTGVSFYDDLIPGNKENDYMALAKNLKGDIILMSPLSYYLQCADMFGDTLNNLISSRKSDVESLLNIENILDNGNKLWMPYIFKENKAQEGLHRMYVLGERYGWNTDFPVLVVSYVNPELEQEKANLKLGARLERVIEEVKDWSYEDLNEVVELIQFEVNKEFKYDDDLFDTSKDIPVIIQPEDNKINITLNNVTKSIELNDLSINEELSELDDFNLDDIDNIDDSWLLDYFV